MPIESLQPFIQYKLAREYLIFLTNIASYITHVCLFSGVSELCSKIYTKGKSASFLTNKLNFKYV